MVNTTTPNKAKDMTTTVQRIFPRTVDLKSYLYSIFLSSEKFLHDDDPIQYRKFLEEIFVLPLQAPSHNNQVTPACNGRTPMREVINRIVAQMVRSGSNITKEQNCLSLGYRRKAVTSAAMLRNYHDIECAFVNTVQPMVMNKNWQLLLDRVGENIVRSILENPVFLKSVNGCFLQLSGTAGSELVQEHGNPVYQTGKGEKKRSRTTANTPSMNNNTASNSKAQEILIISGNTAIPHHRILYNIRPFDANGLPKTHFLFHKTPKEIAKDLMSNSYSQITVKQVLEEYLIKVFESIKEKLMKFDFESSFKKFCDKNHRAISKTVKDPLINSSEGVDQRSNKKRKRGSRGGKSNRRKMELLARKRFRSTGNEDITAVSCDVPTLLRSTSLPSSSLLHRTTTTILMPSSSGVPIVHECGTQIPVVAVGEQLINRMVSNITTDIRNSNMFHTQEDSDLSPDISFERSTQPSEQNKGNKAMNSRERNRLKWKLLKKKRRKKLSTHSQVSEQKTDESPLMPLDRKDDLGIHHHYNRRFHTLPSPTKIQILPEIDRLEPPTPLEELEANIDQEIHELSIADDAVSEYIKSIIRFLLPSSDSWDYLPSSHHNFNLIMRKIDDYIRLGRHESFTIEQIMHKMRLLDLPIVQMYRQRLQSAPTIMNMSQIDHESMIVGYGWVYWIFNSLINYALSNAFYITEIEGKGLQLFYFSKKAWYQIVKKNMTSFYHHFVPVLLSEEYLQEQENEMKQTSIRCLNSHSSHQRINDKEQESEYALKRAKTDPARSSSSTMQPVSFSNSSAGNVLRSRSHEPNSSNCHPTNVNNHFAPQKVLPNTTQSKSILFNDWIRQQHQRSSASGVPTTIPLSDNTCPISLTPVQSSSNLSLRPTLNEIMLQTVQPSLQLSTNDNPRSSFLTNRSSTKSLKLKQFLYQIPTIRFLPKKGTIRPITNLRSKQTGGSKVGGGLEIISNRMLYNVYHVLKTIYDENLQVMKGFSVFGLDEIYQKLETFKQHLFSQSSSKDVGEVYMMTLDLQKCYDHIHTPLLYDILHHILTGEPFPFELYFPSQRYNQFLSTPPANYSIEKECNSDEEEDDEEGEEGEENENKIFPEEDGMIHRYTIIHTIHSMKRIITKSLKMVTFHHEILSFDKIGKTIATSYPNSLIQDHVVASKLTVREILRLLKQHLFNHVIKMPMNHCFTIDHLFQQNPSSVTKTSTSSSHHHQKRRRRRKAKNQSSEIGRDDDREGNQKNTSSSSHLKRRRKQDNRVHTHFFTQVKGIPQGSVLSPLFCNIYYGFLEKIFFQLSTSTLSSSSYKRKCSFGISTKESLVMRMMDDYLILSTKLDHLQSIYHVIREEFALFGGVIHPKKIQINFSPHLIDLSVNVNDGDLKAPLPLLTSDAISDSSFINYCGLRIHQRLLLLEPHLDKLLPTTSNNITPLFYSINLHSSRVTYGLQKSIKQFFRIKCHAIFLDNQINAHPSLTSSQCKTWIVKNLYLLFLLTSFRTFLYLSRLRHLYFDNLISEEYIFHCIEELMLFAYSLIQIRTNHEIFRKIRSHDNSYKDQRDRKSRRKVERGNSKMEGIFEESESPPEEREDREASKDPGGTIVANRKVDFFGFCPVEKIEVESLGWKAFHVISDYYPQYFRMSRGEGRKSHSLKLDKNNRQGSKLSSMIQRRYYHEIQKLKAFYYGDLTASNSSYSNFSQSRAICEKRSLGVDDRDGASPFSLNELLQTNPDIVMQQLIPIHLSSLCEQYFIKYIKKNKQ